MGGRGRGGDGGGAVGDRRGDGERVGRLLPALARAAYNSGRLETVRAWFDWIDDHGGPGAYPVAALLGSLGTVGPFVRQAMAQEDGGDVDIVNFALTLEYLEAAFYQQALARVSGLSGDVKELATTIRDNENVHVKALKATVVQLGGKPVKAPAVDFGNAFMSQASFLKLAQTFEDTGVSAYNGAAPAINPTTGRAALPFGASGALISVL